MPEMTAGNLLGERKAKGCDGLTLYFPIKQELNNSLVDFPLVKAEASWFTKCLKFESDQIGMFILFYKDLKKAEFFRTNQD